MADMSEAALPAASGLTEREAALLDFEASWWSAAEGKEAALLERFQLSSPSYYQHLNALIDRPEALEYSPTLVKRLRRQRQRRQENRSARKLSVRSHV